MSCEPNPKAARWPNSTSHSGFRSSSFPLHFPVNPIRGLTAERLAAQIDGYVNGYVANFALTVEAMEQRDDILKNVITKRKKAVTRHGWEVLAENDSPEARQQRAALDYFYRHLTCSHALRRDERGGFQLLVYQMMDAVAKGYAVHEIVWKPKVNTKSEVRSAKYKAPGERPDSLRPSELESRPFVGRSASDLPNSAEGPEFFRTSDFEFRTSPELPPEFRTSHFDLHTYLTAHFQFVPLWYFEGTTGRLRFQPEPGVAEGTDLEERNWLVTTGEALMIACARAFLFKHQPLQAWLDYTQHFGFPGLRGMTSATRGTPEFQEMEEALSQFMKNLSVVTNSAESIDVIDLKGHGQPPFADLVERMDRVMAALWRGADLSTISRDRGYGASLQEQESDLLEQDDARTLSDHLNATVDRWVIEMLFGRHVEQLARVKILVTPEERTPHDLAVDQFLVDHGAKLSIAETLERYGRGEAKPGEDWLNAKSEIRRAK